MKSFKTFIREDDVNKKGFYAVDFDGTLAFKPEGHEGKDLGEPIPAMLDRVKQWITDGREVKIFTARKTAGGQEAVDSIHKWCKRHGLPELEVINTKEPGCEAFYDDKAISVERNTGEITSLIKR